MKTKTLTFFLFYFVIRTSLFAQLSFDFSGYAQNYTVYQKLDEELAGILRADDSYFVNLFRLRLKPVFHLWKGGRLNIDYELTASCFTQKYFTGEFGVPDNRRQLTELMWTPVDDEKIKVSHFIDRLYLRQKLPFGNVIIGRQRIAWGTGRVWNPVDLFNPVNPAAYYLIEKPGADAVSAKIRLGSFTDLNLVYNPIKNFKSYNFAGRFRTNFWEYDFSVMGGRFGGKTVVGMDFAGNILDAGFRGEGIYSFDSGVQQHFLKFILGIDYQFSPVFYLLAEYHFNGEGKTDEFSYEYYRLLNGEILNLGRNYLALSGMYQISPLFLMNFISIVNLNDESGFVSLAGNYSVTEDFYLNPGIQLFFGKLFTEYWHFPDSFYIQAEYYF